MLSSWNNVIENTSFGYTAFMFFRNLERTYTFFSWSAFLDKIFYYYNSSLSQGENAKQETGKPVQREADACWTGIF